MIGESFFRLMNGMKFVKSVKFAQSVKCTECEMCTLPTGGYFGRYLLN